ncbi:MAG: flippase [Firmicutes bacterium]|nr:flippase [Bacillota bacterium]
MSNKSIKTNAIFNVSKQFVSVLFPFILYPYITRVLGTANFGRYSFAYSIAEYAMLVAALGVPTYGTREGAQLREDKKKFSRFASEMLGINFLALVSALVVLFACTIFVPRIHREASLILVLAINVVAYGFSRDYFFDAYENYAVLAIRYICFKGAVLIGCLLLVKESDDLILFTFIMAGTEALGYVITMLYGTRYAPIKIRLGSDLKKHMKPIMFLFSTTVAVRIYIQLDITILGFFVSDSDIGIYTLAAKIYSVVKSILNAAIFVCIPRIALYIGQNKREEYNKLLNKVMEILPAGLLPCIVGVFCLSRNILLIMGGEDFVGGATALRLLCMALLFAVFGCFFAQGVIIPNCKDRSYFTFTVIAAVTNAVLNLILIPMWGMNAAAVTTVIAELIICVLCGLTAFKLFDAKPEKSIISVLIGCAAIAAVCVVCLSLLPTVALQTIFSIVVSVIAYALILIIAKHPAALIGIDMLRSIASKFTGRR